MTTPRLFVHRSAALALIATLALGAGGVAHADKRNPEIDYLGVAETLLRDGAVDRAEAALANVDPAAEGVDLARYWTITGLIRAQNNELDAAASAFDRALAAGSVEPMVVIYLAQAYFGKEDWAKVIATLDRGGDGVEALSSAWSMRAHAEWVSGLKQAALDTLREASKRFPANSTFARRQVFYLIELGLYQESARVAEAFLARPDIGADEYATVGNALRRARSFTEAKQILEAARLRYPDNAVLAKTLAQTYLEAGDTFAAAEILNEVAAVDPGLTAEAAELYRRSGAPMQALMLNARVTDATKKLKQRIGILAELRRYEEIAGMEAALDRAGLLDDEDVRYALAFAHFRGGDFDRAEAHLAALTRTDLFRKATELRRIMGECADQRWTCT